MWGSSGGFRLVHSDDYGDPDHTNHNTADHKVSGNHRAPVCLRYITITKRSTLL
ncbi:hypothetical protein DPMN_111456 [Dreissena polymorpha]|uniref:Uncharacterized protein n=1 Tax=Dreissena polymorpha TaxID=45954 RepID=A0A9D4QPX9_DREPO|nr:hypothetical protein DPMN_111456 [Dreissena polymorpha]